MCTPSPVNHVRTEPFRRHRDPHPSPRSRRSRQRRMTDTRASGARDQSENAIGDAGPRERDDRSRLQPARFSASVAGATHRQPRSLPLLVICDMQTRRCSERQADGRRLAGARKATLCPGQAHTHDPRTTHAVAGAAPRRWLPRAIKADPGRTRRRCALPLPFLLPVFAAPLWRWRARGAPSSNGTQ